MCIEHCSNKSLSVCAPVVSKTIVLVENHEKESALTFHESSYTQNLQNIEIVTTPVL